jgi:hypothetical protein
MTFTVDLDEIRSDRSAYFPDLFRIQSQPDGLRITGRTGMKIEMKAEKTVCSSFSHILPPDLHKGLVTLRKYFRVAGSSLPESFR